MTPAPKSEMVSGELVALLVTIILPVTLPAAAGAKVAVRVAVCPGVRITPETPVALKPAPDTLTLEIVMLEFPAFVNVTACALLFARVTLPKFKEDALELRRSVEAPTVSVAGMLVALPAVLLTVTVNAALLSAVVSAGVVYVDEVAPLIAAPFLLH